MITQRSIATTAEIHAPLTVGVLRVPYCRARQRLADCRVAISAKHLTSTGRAWCTSQLSAACSEMTEQPVVSAAGSRHDAYCLPLVKGNLEGGNELNPAKKKH